MAFSNSISISPRKLRDDLYLLSSSSSSYEEDVANSSSSSSNNNMPLVISVLASLIERTLARNERIMGKKLCTSNSNSNYKDGTGVVVAAAVGGEQVFDCHEAPDMSIQSYLERIFRYTRAGPSVYVVAYVYIDRFCQLYPKFRISARNVHRLLITTIMVASKYVEDMNYRNSYFARVGGLCTKEMNKLEMKFLFMVGFKLHVNVSVFESYCCHLEREVSIGGGYQIERTLRCAEEIKSRHTQHRRYTTQTARVLL